MTIERMILILSWALIVLLLWLFVPPNKRREAAFMFLAGQALCWLASHIIVELEWLNSPIREFPKATGTNFTFNYALFPVYYALYGLYYPRRKHLWLKMAYIAMLPALITCIFYWIDKHTLLFRLVQSAWYAGYGLLFLSSYAIKFYNDWFFNRLGKQAA